MTLPFDLHGNPSLAHPLRRGNCRCFCHGPRCAVPAVPRPRRGETMKRIYVVEYSTLVRNRIREAIAGLGDCMIVGEAEAANEAVLDIDELNPDVVITDLLLRDGTGIDV